MKSNSKNIVAFATLGALIFIAMTLDRAITPFLPLSAAFITLTVTFTFALVRPNLALSLAAALIFGLSSCITAIFFGKESVINPLISVLPRFLLGFIIFGVYVLMRLIMHKASPKTRETVSLAVASAFTAASNTVLFLSAMVLFGENNTVASLFKITVLANAVPELVLSAVLVPVVVLALRKAMKIDVDKIMKKRSGKETTLLERNEPLLLERNEPLLPENSASKDGSGILPDGGKTEGNVKEISSVADDTDGKRNSEDN